MARQKVLGVLRGEEQLVPGTGPRTETETATPSVLLERRYTMLSRGDGDDEDKVPPTVAVTGNDDVGVTSLERRYTVDGISEDDEDDELPSSIERRFTIGPSVERKKADSEESKE